MLSRRALTVAVPVTLAAAAVVNWLGKPWSALALTVTAAVGIINGLWLEGVLKGVLQPGRPHVTRAAVGLLIARWALWGLLFVVLYLMRERIELWSVAVGVACFLVALGIAGMRVADRGGQEG
jgi:predicted outer membrane lipoprotein